MILSLKFYKVSNFELKKNDALDCQKKLYNVLAFELKKNTTR